MLIVYCEDSTNDKKRKTAPPRAIALCATSVALNVLSGPKKIQKRVRILKPQTDLAVIPGGLTSVVQPLDICLNKPFKDLIRQYWSAWIIDGEKTFTKGGNMRAPPLDLLCEWVVRAWAAIDAKIVENSFLKCGISNSLDGEEDDWLWKDMDAEDDTADAEEE